MSYSSNSLQQVFNGQQNEGFQSNLGQSLDSEAFSAIRQSVTKKSSSITWSGLSEEIKSKTGDLLSVSIPDILVRAWNKAGILNKFINKEKYDPEEVFLIELKEHTISSKHEPYLDLQVNNKSIGKINFEINLEIVVQGAVLRIQDVKIKQIKAGSLKISGSINCEGLEIAKKESKEIYLPGKIDFGEGIPIAP